MHQANRFAAGARRAGRSGKRAKRRDIGACCAVACSKASQTRGCVHEGNCGSAVLRAPVALLGVRLIGKRLPMRARRTGLHFAHIFGSWLVRRSGLHTSAQRRGQRDRDNRARENFLRHPCVSCVSSNAISGARKRTNRRQSPSSRPGNCAARDIWRPTGLSPGAEDHRLARPAFATRPHCVRDMQRPALARAISADHDFTRVAGRLRLTCDHSKNKILPGRPGGTRIALGARQSGRPRGAKRADDAIR